MSTSILDLALRHEDHIQRAQPAPAPIFILPFDILYKIFLLLHAEDPSRFRFAVSRVCQHWRAAALDCPFLWTNVAFERRLPYWEKEKEFVRRSGNAGLEISLGYATFRTSSIKKLKRIMKIILPHAARWKSLAIFSIPLKVFRILIDDIRHLTFPMLQTLQIYGVKMEGRWKDPSLSWSMPILRSLSLEPSPFVHSSPIFDNLHVLRINSGYTSELGTYTILQHLQAILARSPALHTLETLDYVPAHRGNPIAHTNPPLLHPSLRRLKVGRGLTEGLFALVHMPSLDTWEADMWSSKTGPSASFHMLTVLSKWPSPCKLESFEIEGNGQLQEISSLQGALRVLPLLHTLRFNFVDFSNTGWPADISTLCPRLETLQFDNCAGITGKDLLSTVQNQSEGDAGKAAIMLIEIHDHLQRMEVDEGAREALRAVVELRLQEETGMSRTCWSCPRPGSAW